MAERLAYPLGFWSLQTILKSAVAPKMARKYVIADTDENVMQASNISCAGTPPDKQPQLGSLVEVEFVDGNPRLGIVIEIRHAGCRPHGVPWLKIIFNDGKQELIRSPNVRVINQRRRKKRT
jgi:hypothetical protein